MNSFNKFFARLFSAAFTGEILLCRIVHPKYMFFKIFIFLNKILLQGRVDIYFNQSIEAAIATNEANRSASLSYRVATRLNCLM